jgi:hypothetical protein
MSNPSPPKGKPKEDLLREKVRYWMDSLIKQMQWGLTLMVSIQTALVFIRRDLLSTFVAGGLLKVGEELPYHRYLVGTVFLGVAATILWALTNRSAKQYRHYKKQLLECEEKSGIVDQPPTGISKWIGVFYFAFPVLDIAV